jgi:hypothetical protein
MQTISDLFHPTAFDPEAVKTLCDAYDKPRNNRWGLLMTNSRFLQSITSHITAVVAVGTASLVLAWHYVF